MYPSHACLPVNTDKYSALGSHTLPSSIGLFHRAISQSGCVLNSWLYARYPKQQAQSLAKKVNCPTQSSQEMVKCLKNVNAKDIVSTHREMRVQLRKHSRLTLVCMLFVPY